MSTEIRLKLKYREHVVPKKNRNGRSDNQGKKRTSRPLTDHEKALHAAQPVKILVLLSSGKTRMVTVG